MSTKAERSAAASVLGASGRGASKRRGDAAHYAALRMKREGTVTIEDMREAAGSLLEFCPGHAGDARVAAWLEREADRRERINEQRALARKRER